MDNNSRLSPEKQREFDKRYFDALAEGDFDAITELEKEREELEASIARPATEATEDTQAVVDDDTYIPEDDITKPAFGSIDDDTPEKLDNPLEGLDLDRPLPEDADEPSAEQTPDEEPPQPEHEAPVDEDGVTATPLSQRPRRSISLDELDDEELDDDTDEGKQNPFQQFIAWLQEDETGKRKWLTALGALGVVLVILLGIIVLTGGEDDTPPPEPEPEQQQVEESEDNQPAAAIPGTIAPANVEARCANDNSDPAAMFDTDNSTAWICQRLFGVDGVPVTIDLGSQSTISSVAITPGFNFVAPRGEDEWTNHRVVTRVQWQFDDPDNSQFTQEIVPSRNSVKMDIPDVPATQVTMTILATQPAEPGAPEPEPGSDQDTFAVSDITITGTGS